MRKWDKKGFTFIEIMTVVIILGILVAIVAPRFFGRADQARITAAKADIETNLSTALEMYQLDNRHFPSTDQGLRALMDKPSGAPDTPNWNGPYLKRKKLPKDPWGKDYVYVSPGVHNTKEYDLSSLGPDGVESADDITNWEGETAATQDNNVK